jgi:hypothetical protein
MRTKQQHKGFALAMLMTIMVMSVTLGIIVMLEVAQMQRGQQAGAKLDKDIKQLSQALERYYLAECKAGNVSQASDLVGKYIGRELHFDHGGDYQLSLSVDTGRPVATVSVTLEPAFVHLAKTAVVGGAELSGNVLSRQMLVLWAGNAFDHVLLREAKAFGGVAC